MAQRAVIVVCDSLRRDMISAQTAPTLSALRARSAHFTAARGVFPSVTRVSAASLATGCHPGSHGLLGNTMVLDEGEGLTCLSVGDPDFRHRLRAVTGRTLQRPTLAERLRQHGGAIAFSNVSPGAAYFLDPDNYGFVYHRAGSFGPGGDALPAADGLSVESGIDGDAAMTARFCQEVLCERRPALALLWLSEPDWTGHTETLGSPAHRAAIAAADACVREVLEVLDQLDPAGDEILRVVCSDHGMETVDRTIDLDAILIEAGLKHGVRSKDVVVAPNGTAALIYLAPEANDRRDAIAAFLAGRDWVGQVFTGSALMRVGLSEEAGPALALTLKSRDAPNAYGVYGRSDMVADPQDPGPFASMHGGLGAGEQQPFLFVRGPGIAPAPRADRVSLVDIAPTVLAHLGIAAEAMDGRALHATDQVSAKPNSQTELEIAP
ncbi:MAG: alkaline phosphatase family protein [Kiloniellales bacterium]|nr:alkaline phosphatase family protein [Kiloniellales bacterium]